MGVKDWLTKQAITKFLKPMYDKLDGKKTYVVLGVAVLLGGLETWNALCGETIQAQWCVDIIVPPVVYTILAALGIYTRAVAKPKKG